MKNIMLFFKTRQQWKKFAKKVWGMNRFLIDEIDRREKEISGLCRIIRKLENNLRLEREKQDE